MAGRPLWYVSAAAGLLCVKDSVLGDRIKETPVFNLRCKKVKRRQILNTIR